MLFVRSLFYFIISTLLVVTITFIGLIFFFLPFSYRYNIISMWAKSSIYLLDIICNLKIKVIGKENIPTKACVVVVNHQSTWETLALQTILPNQTWVLKKELLFIPFFGWGLALLEPIIINRGNKIQAIKKVIKQGVLRLKNNIFVIIFPEGTRQPYNKLGIYQSGGFVMAKKANKDILPICHNAGKYWAKGKFIKKPGVITVIINKPISTKDKEISSLITQVRELSVRICKDL